MNRWLLGFVAIAGMAREVRAGPGTLHVVGVVRERDSVWVDFDFREGRPARFRVMQYVDSTRKPCLQIEFQPAAVDPKVVAGLPKWMPIRRGADSALSVFVELDRDVPWQSQWRDRVLRVSFLDRIRSVPVWRNPWLVMGVSSAVAAGGAAFWLLGGGSSQSPPSDGVIPPPDVVLPR